MKKENPDQKNRVAACRALEFLREHPAFNASLADSLCNGMWFYMTPCCKRGYSESSKNYMTIYRNSKGWKKFKDRFDREAEEDKLEGSELEFQSINVTYKERFNEPWSFDHVEYWYELSFSVFEGDPYKDSDSWDYKKWGNYQGVEGGAKTFEDMLLDAARKHKKYFGNFKKYQDFHTDAEKRCQKDIQPFHFKPVEGQPKLSEMISNRDYVDVSDGLVNLRWLKWFIEQDYAKKNWKEPIGSKWAAYINKIDAMEPKSRKKLLAKYE